MDELNEFQDSQTPEVAEEPLENLATAESVQVSQFEELKEKNQKLFARAKKAEEDRKKLRDELAAKAPKQEPQQPTQKQEPSDDLEVALSLLSRGYSDAEVLTARKYARRMGISVEEVINDPFIKSGFEAERAKAKVEQATPAPSGKVSDFAEAAKQKLSFNEFKAQKRQKGAL